MAAQVDLSPNRAASRAAIGSRPRGQAADEDQAAAVLAVGVGDDLGLPGPAVIGYRYLHPAWRVGDLDGELAVLAGG